MPVLDRYSSKLFLLFITSKKFVFSIIYNKITQNANKNNPPNSVLNNVSLPFVNHRKHSKNKTISNAHTPQENNAKYLRKNGIGTAVRHSTENIHVVIVKRNATVNSVAFLSKCNFILLFLSCKYLFIVYSIAVFFKKYSLYVLLLYTVLYL